MMDASPVEQVRAGVDIVDLVSQHVTLKKAGRIFKAVCPFHTEKTPSFCVFPETGRWHCFGCGEGGDVFTFLMKIENLTFVEALRQLADRIGVTISHTREPEERREAHKRLYAANEAAALYYNSLLLNSTATRKYVAGRGINDDTLREYLLGLAPDSYDAMQRNLIGQGYTRDELLEAGLLYEPEQGPARDRYRGRLMFPIRDGEGRIVSFGARGLASDAQPKYLNGPQTAIFDKGATLYGLFHGAQLLKKERRAVVVEGYVDVVIAHQAGFRNVVATLGTSITDRHLRQLARLAGEIILALDPDTAGETAALRGAEVARTALADTATPVPTWRGLVRYEAASRASIMVAALPDGKDPDEVILESADLWRETINAAQPVIDFALGWVVGRYDVSTVQGKSEATEALSPLLLDISDPIRRSHYVELAAQRLRVDATSLMERLRQSERAARGRKNSLTAPRGAPAALPRARPLRDQDYAIALMAVGVERGMPLTELDPTDFTDPAARALVDRISALLHQEARDDWRPDVLDLARADWLETPIARVEALCADVRRLTDVQITAEVHRVSQQLRLTRLAVEIGESTLLLDEADADDVARILATIAQKNLQRAALWHGDGAAGSAGLGKRAAIIPSRFRLPTE